MLERKLALFRGRLWILVVALVALIGLGEIAARVLLGLGDPPLSIAHPTIEYMFKPNQDTYPLHHHVHINAYGMRSPDFPARKRDASEYRVIVFGDSVINGGNQTDDAQLATTLLQQELSTKLGRPVVVGNVSAGSWGPPNMLAYAREFGFFDADMVLIVVSSHDYSDAPTFEPLNPSTHPTERPTSALYDGATRYLPRFIPSLAPPSERPPPPRPASYRRVIGSTV